MWTYGNGPCSWRNGSMNWGFCQTEMPCIRFTEHGKAILWRMVDEHCCCYNYASVISIISFKTQYFLQLWLIMFFSFFISNFFRDVKTLIVEMLQSAKTQGNWFHLFTGNKGLPSLSLVLVFITVCHLFVVFHLSCVFFIVNHWNTVFFMHSNPSDIHCPVPQLRED